MVRNDVKDGDSKYQETSKARRDTDCQTRKSSFRQQLDNLEYGNYPSYYKYRNKTEPNASESYDQRLDHLKKDWFEGKDVLDIGCNVGDITYNIAKLYNPKTIVGLDIDEKLINTAMKSLNAHMDSLIDSHDKLRRLRAERQYRQSKNDTELLYQEDPLHFPLSLYLKNGPLIVTQDSREVIEDNIMDLAQSSQLTKDNSEQDAEALNVTDESNLKREDCSNRVACENELANLQSDLCDKFPNNVGFIVHDYVLDNDDLVNLQEAHYDVIVCLSVTKWIHLNYRDEGLKRFFKRMFLHLKPNGGRLILEAQPFTNYGRRKKLSQRIKDNYQSIQLKPEQFESFLLSDEIGFATCEYTGVTSHAHSGFQRPIQVFRKD